MSRAKISKQYCACHGRPGIDKPPSNCTGERDTHCNRGCYKFFCGTCYLDSTRHSCDLRKNVLPPPKEAKRKSEHAGWGATIEELGEDPNYKQPKGQKLAHRPPPSLWTPYTMPQMNLFLSRPTMYTTNGPSSPKHRRTR